jgi:hypothetical protein
MLEEARHAAAVVELTPCDQRGVSARVKQAGIFRTKTELRQTRGGQACAQYLEVEENDSSPPHKAEEKCVAIHGRVAVLVLVLLICSWGAGRRAENGGQDAMFTRNAKQL